MKAIGLTLVAVGVALAALPVAAAQDACSTQFTLVGKDDLKWYLEGGSAANPTLTACPDQEVTFLLVTEGSQVHNFKVEAQGAPPTTATFEEGDEPVTYAMTTPASGSAKYICVIHGNAMAGTVNFAQTATAGGGETKESPGFAGALLGIALVGAALLARVRRS